MILIGLTIQQQLKIKKSKMKKITLAAILAASGCATVEGIVTSPLYVAEDVSHIYKKLEPESKALAIGSAAITGIFSTALRPATNVIEGAFVDLNSIVSTKHSESYFHRKLRTLEYQNEFDREHFAKKPEWPPKRYKGNR